MIAKLLKYSLFGFIFTVPFSISFVFWDKFSYFSWHFSHFSSIVIYLSDIFLLLSLFLYLIFVFKKPSVWVSHFHFFRILNLKSYFWHKDKKFNLLFFIFIISFFIPFFFAKDFVLHLILSFKFLSILFLFFYVPDEILSKKDIWNVLLFSFLIQWFIAIYQFLFQSYVWFSFLWEVNIWKNELWVAKFSLENWEKIVRAYWTTQHANILWISSVIAFYLANFSSFRVLRWLLVFPILFSFSRIAWVLFVLILVFELIEKKEKRLKIKGFYKTFFFYLSSLVFTLLLLYFFLPLIDRRLSFLDASLTERLEQFQISFEMLVNNPFWVWFWNFVLNMQDFSSKIFQPWQFQPVHNFFLIFANEIWALALTIFLTLLIFLFKNSNSEIKNKIIIFFLLFIPFLWEHYFFTSTIWITLLAILLRLI